MAGFGTMADRLRPMESLAGIPGWVTREKGRAHEDVYDEAKPVLEALDPLGEPLSIAEAARVLGCSVWTVRQRFLPLGLPHLRLGPAGRITFFRNQVTAWVLAQQKLSQEGRISSR
jgi:hypothetical protein